MSTRAEEQIRADIVEAGRRLYARAYIASNDGNISARLDDQRLITTPKSVSKGFMTPDMMVIVDYQGNKVAGDRDPSTELPMHLEIYRNRPDVNAVVHAHPPLATGFAATGNSMSSSFRRVSILNMGLPLGAGRLLPHAASRYKNLWPILPPVTDFSSPRNGCGIAAPGCAGPAAPRPGAAAWRRRRPPPRRWRAPSRITSRL